MDIIHIISHTETNMSRINIYSNKLYLPYYFIYSRQSYYLYFMKIIITLYTLYVMVCVPCFQHYTVYVQINIKN